MDKPSESLEKGSLEFKRAKFLENLRKAGLEMEEVLTDILVLH